ncbi:uncharacterized protein PV07_06237 [Cladophialophora immunda]|uniref:Cyanovirin-N domain-containing protein n=1 Tax=Cladophialophora immunda TaxID=569365 RepID=A0A0D2CKC3_9EURO|nr:uncharacterized protein PV07_06237 [Cladophialophora immunda]KIW30495.1 hypothetical protein PV07_06237 [Cladophialophora immunda]
MSSFLAKAMLALSLPVFLAHAQDAALCGNACDTYQLNLKNTDDIYTEDVLTPGSPITGADVLQMCGDFSEFSLDGLDYGSAIICYKCGGFGGSEADEDLLDAWALVCATYNEADPDDEPQVAEEAGATCWNSDLAVDDCGTLASN